MTKKFLRRFLCAALSAATVFLAGTSTSADERLEKKTIVEERVAAEGVYKNWDGVSNVAQFLGANGEFCFAYDGEEYVTVVRTREGSTLKKKIKLKKPYPLFGTVTADAEGNYYLVTGRVNETDDTSVNTVFISKFNKNGKLIKTVGDNGSSSLAYYYSNDYRTKIPFDGGCCAAAINGDLLTVNYAREMYSGHQSNSVFTVRIDTMKAVDLGVWYNSHSFAQRAIPFGDGFVYVSEGDGYDRAFTTWAVHTKNNAATSTNEGNIFHFWVEKGTFDRWDMFTLNDNFAHMGGLAAVGDKVALVATSAKSMNKNAEDENEQLFIQIFDPFKDLSKSGAYVTEGKRSGKSGKNGDESATDYGVKWLTNYKDQTIANPQVVATDDGKIVVLYEKTESYEYKGVYYIVLNEKGKVIQKAKRFSADARLNPCVMPVYSAKDGICWAANAKSDTDHIYVYRLKLD
ncbi:MAG: hypothetical protein NC084_03260 [Bacteroides sp.]|nr:hypothetical protein [Eubacterium sp.]MCM1417574.1 hypothetical protein [Roseburia sp.]MCM1461715.1 hypothetical protein [Bacteroides sp.]